MSNGNLNCSATNCAHNNGGNCYAGGINVAGSSATTTSNTCCSSFVDKSNAGFTNCGDGCKCTKTNNISCQAGNCKYNSLGACTANSVQINAQSASCETVICE